MAEPTPVPLGVSSADGRTPAEGGSRLINCFADRVGEAGKHQSPIYAVDGFEAFSTITGTGVGAIRGGLPLTVDALYVVTGSRVAKVAANGTASLLTGDVTASGLVTMARNRKEPDAQIAICIASADGALYFIEDDTLTAFDLDNLGSEGKAVGVTTMAGYFIILFSNGEFYITAIDDDEIDELDFAKAEANPDGGVAITVLSEAVLVLGEKSAEFWTLSGVADFPFERSTVRNYGCYAAGSLQNLVQVRGGGEIADTVVFAATDSNGFYIGVCIMSGTSPVKISSPQVDRAILAEANKASIRSEVWANGERSLYALHTSTQTFVYDFATGYWHERKSSALSFWRAACAFAFGTKVIVGDYALAKLYHLKSGLYNAATASVVTLRHSNDGGQTWVTRGPKPIGLRARFNRIGRGKYQGKKFEISISEAVMEDGVGLPMTIETPIVHAWPNPALMAAAHIDIVPGVSQASRTKGVLALALQADLLTEQAHTGAQ